MPIAKQVQFGDLILGFTTEFSWRWDDGGSGGSYDGSFFHPEPPSGFHALGSLGFKGYDNPDGKYASLCVKEASSGGKAALSSPAGYELIWADSGSGARADGSCWRPIPKSGYVALGDVFQRGYGKPSISDVMCVSRELVAEGLVGDRIWIDRNTGAHQDFGSWAVQVYTGFKDTTDGVFAVGTFTSRGGTDAHNKPSASPVVWNLRLPLPTTSGPNAKKPSLEGRTSPPTTTNAVVDRIVTVPYTCIQDKSSRKPLKWIVEHTPFYNVERSVSYDLVNFLDNTTESEQNVFTEVTTGISKETSDTFSISTGISVEATSGVSVHGVGGSVSVTMSVELGYSHSNTVAAFRQETDNVTLTVSPGQAGAVWTEKHTLGVRRGNDGARVSRPISFDTSASSCVFSEYPKR